MRERERRGGVGRWGGGALGRKAAAAAFCIEVSRYISGARYTGHSAKAWYLLVDVIRQHHAQVYEGKREAIIDPALWMRTRAALGTSSRANGVDIGTTADTRLINAPHRGTPIAAPSPTASHASHGSGARGGRRLVVAKFDSAKTTPENRKHWANADRLSPKAAINPEVRRVLRNRARYEVANNSCAKALSSRSPKAPPAPLPGCRC